jgi:hypothetical protein
MIARVVVPAVCLLVLFVASPARAHSGPPYPIVSDRIVGPYRVSLWTDPDTTDDRTPRGQFWVRVDAAAAGTSLPPSTRAEVSIRPSDRAGSDRHGATVPVSGDVGNQYVALLMDHEGPFAVHVMISGPLGSESLDSAVSATYDLRPTPYLMAVYVLPLVLVGLLWGRLIVRRRRNQ